MGGSFLQTLEEKVGSEASALIVIDMQNDFCHPNGFLSRGGKDLTQIKEMIPKLLEFIAAAREAGGRILFVKAVYDDKYCNEPMLERKSRLGIADVVCPEGQWGSEFYEGFEPQPEDFVITKTRYSAFLGGNLKEVLDRERIRSLIITGVTTNCCVESTARDG
ncbi:MAG: cysteine hydrolase family protein, partial [Thermodesulfobacteriota bacterium]